MEEKKIKVLMVNHEFPPIGGGGGTTTRFLAKYLSRKNVDVNILTARPEKEVYYEHPDGFKLFYTGKTKKKIITSHIPEMAMFTISTLLNAKPLIQKVNPDLVHCFFSIPSGCFGLYAKTMFNLPYIVSALGADVPGFNIGDWRLNVYHKITHGMSKAIWDNSSFLVANSSSLQELCKNFDKEKDVMVIPNGVDELLFYPNEQKDFNKTNINILFVSRLMPQKGIDTLISACGLLKERKIENYNLTVVGDGHLRELMYSLIEKHNIKDKVNHLGWKKLEELPDIYRNSDIFVLPSSMEGMPSVVLQAMSCGLPIIATRVEGFKEVLENNINGISVEYNNAHELSQALEKLIKSPHLRKEMGNESIKKAKKYSWESIANEYLEIYRRTVGILSQENNFLKSTIR